MTTPLPVRAPDLKADMVDEGRWNTWKAQGRADGRQTATRMRVVAALVAVGLAAWLTRAVLAIP